MISFLAITLTGAFPSFSGTSLFLSLLYGLTVCGWKAAYFEGSFVCGSGVLEKVGEVPFQGCSVLSSTGVLSLMDDEDIICGGPVGLI